MDNLKNAFQYKKLLLLTMDQLSKIAFQFTPYFLTLERPDTKNTQRIAKFSFNTPAMNFKKKLRARYVKKGLFIKLFHKIKFDICLKKYPA